MIENKIIELGEKLVNRMYELKNTISFVELEHFFIENDVDYEGSVKIVSNTYENLTLWEGWNQLAVDVYLYVMNKLDDKLHFYKCDPIVYLVDGKVIQLPVAKLEQNYVSERWLPTLMEVV